MSGPAAWSDVRQWHRPLLLVAAVTAPFVVISLAGTVLDDRVLVGAPIWAKPFEFAVSVVLYAVTWSWLLAGLRQHRLARRAGTVIAAAAPHHTTSPPAERGCPQVG